VPFRRLPHKEAPLLPRHDLAGYLSSSSYGMFPSSFFKLSNANNMIENFRSTVFSELCFVPASPAASHRQTASFFSITTALSLTYEILCSGILSTRVWDLPISSHLTSHTTHNSLTSLTSLTFLTSHISHHTTRVWDLPFSTQLSHLSPYNKSLGSILLYTMLSPLSPHNKNLGSIHLFAPYTHSLFNRNQESALFRHLFDSELWNFYHLFSPPLHNKTPLQKNFKTQQYHKNNIDIELCSVTAHQKTQNTKHKTQNTKTTPTLSSALSQHFKKNTKHQKNQNFRTTKTHQTSSLLCRQNWNLEED